MKPNQTEISKILYSNNRINTTKLKRYNISIQEAYNIYHDIKTPKCPLCEKDKHFINFHIGYDDTCRTYKCKTVFNRMKSIPDNINKSWVLDTFFKGNDRFNCNKFNEYKDLIKLEKNELYNIIHDIETPKCHFCDNDCNFTTFVSGYDNACSNPDCRDKMRTETNMEKYGVHNPALNKKVNETRKQTMIDRYGVDHPSKSKELINKGKISRAKNDYDYYINEIYNDDYHLSITTPKEDFVLNRNHVDFKCKLCNEEFSKSRISINGLTYRCNNCFPNTNLSQGQQEVAQFIRDNIDIELNESGAKILEDIKRDVDIYLPDLNLYIEYDGIVWHSFGKSKHSKFNNYESEDINCHLIKTLSIEKRQGHLFRIWDIEWLNPIKQDIWKSMILNKLNLIQNKIYARKCIIKEVDSVESNKFLMNNHLQGKTNASVKLGLYYEGELVSLMTFGKSRFNKNIEWELIRFCNKKYTSIVGAASKLLKYFERNYHPESIISYANRRWSQGNLYDTLGFEFQRDAEPNYFYFQKDTYELESRIKYQKHKLKDILEDFDPELTETENMYNNDYRKIYDCGNKVYTKHYKGEK